MKFNMILNHNVKILGVGLILNSVIHGMDKDVHPLVSSTSSAIVESALSPRFVDVVEPNAAAKFFFPEILGKARLGYVRKCMPHLDETQLTIAAEILSRIINDGQSQILDAEKIKKNVNGNIIRTDFGYSFPPILKIQGAFLSRCRPKINVLDIGAGSGNDSIMAAISGANVIAVDIIPQQIEQLKNRSKEILKNLGNYRLQTLERDFSKPGSVPEKYVGKIQIINANKIIHFLDDQETKDFINNASLMLSDNGFMFITACAPEQEHERAGVCYTKQTCSISDKANGEMKRENVSKEECPLQTLRHSAEFLSANSEGGLLHTIYYGRHFHTGDTLRDYLSLQFDVIDCAVVRSELNEPFISVIARKRPVNV